MTSSSRARTRSIISTGIALGVIVFIFAYVLPRIANYGDVWKAFKALSPGWLLALLVVTILNLATYAPNWMVALPGLGYRQSIEVTMAGTAVANVAPLGGAVGMGMQMAMFKGWGFERKDASRAMVVTGIWNNLTNLAMPLVGLLVLTTRGGKNLALEAAAKIGAVVLVIAFFVLWQVFRSEVGARSVGRLVDRLRAPIAKLRKKTPPTTGPETLATFRRDSVELIRVRWLALTITTLGGVMFVFVVLAVALRALNVDGDQITYTEAFAAWASTRLLSTAFPVTPGGLGIIEVGLTAALVEFGGARGPVVAAVLLYRVLTYIPPIVLGGLSFLTWRKHPNYHSGTSVAQ
jgi:putative heme transporter